MKIITESEFAARLNQSLTNMPIRPKSVMGPGRSGAIASVYASHILWVPWFPYGTAVPEHLRPLLMIDTATKSGRTLRKAVKHNGAAISLVLFPEPPRVKFWYEKIRSARVSLCTYCGEKIYW